MPLITIKLRASDRAFALRRISTGWLWNPDKLPKPTLDVWETVLRETIDRYGIRFREGWLAKTLRARGVAWHKRRVSVVPGFLALPRLQRMPTQTHEVGHCVLMHKDQALVLKYAIDPRYRWANETRCIAAELRWTRAMGGRRENMIARIERAAASFAKPFPGYNLQWITNLHDETVKTLLRVVDGKA